MSATPTWSTTNCLGKALLVWLIGLDGRRSCLKNHMAVTHYSLFPIPNTIPTPIPTPTPNDEQNGME